MSAHPSTPYVFLDDTIQGTSRYYRNPSAIITALSPQDIPSAFAQMDASLKSGKYLAGYTSYELGLILSDKLASLYKKTRTPLLCFGVFDSFDIHKRPQPQAQTALPTLTPKWKEADYLTRFERVKTYIQNGDIYQANLTFPYEGISETPPDLPHLYASLRGRQPVRYGGIVHLNGPQILSLSPELFFDIKNGQISARPMKGTAPRNADPAIDEAIAKAMQVDEKSRAENLMIVDLLRNDISRISEAGSVKVTDLFTLERYPTLHQMTSGITAKLRPGLNTAQLFSALFPCGSVTGAPKIRAMEIIDTLESGPRGPYCGAIGYLDPNGNSMFNVAIRTLTSTPRHDGKYDIAYHVGSGVVADSDGPSEYAECKLKADILNPAPNISELRETLKWTPAEGYPFLEQHVIRLMSSAQTLGFDYEPSAIFSALDKAIIGKTTPQRVGLQIKHTGRIKATATALQPTPNPLRLCLSRTQLHPDLPTEFKCTNMRRFYDEDRIRVQALNKCDELVYTNQAGELCEGSYTNLFLEINGKLYTPPLSAGLLPGILRRKLIETGKAHIRNLTIEDLSSCDAIYMGNSVRGLCRATLTGTTPI